MYLSGTVDEGKRGVVVWNSYHNGTKTVTADATTSLSRSLTRKVETVSMLRREVAGWRSRHETVALVPTMGSLHPGHLALVEEGRRRCRRLVVSIFVNPKQFGPNEDFARYPRRIPEDIEKLAAIGVDLVFLPSVDEMFPNGFATTVKVNLLSDDLCGLSRPSHFPGVATVVTKLLMQCQPDVVLLGEKDYQQLQVVRALVRDLDIPVTVVAVPTVREPDGLAMSSRNDFLGESERQVATRFAAVLVTVSARLTAGEPVLEALDWGRRELDNLGVNTLEYLELRDAATLLPVDALRSESRLLAAVRIGPTRLIDNLLVAPVG